VESGKPTVSKQISCKKLTVEKKDNITLSMQENLYFSRDFVHFSYSRFVAGLISQQLCGKYSN
jgi:hypothetical protein